jgi:hypothetical protein
MRIHPYLKRLKEKGGNKNFKNKKRYTDTPSFKHVLLLLMQHIPSIQQIVLPQDAHLGFFLEYILHPVCIHINTYLALIVEKYNCQTWEMQAINNVEVSTPSPFST